MAAHVTHEIRNPLSSMGLNVELLEEELALVSDMPSFDDEVVRHAADRFEGDRGDGDVLMAAAICALAEQRQILHIPLAEQKAHLIVHLTDKDLRDALRRVIAVPL